jgi:L-aminopeptidase/D-esterase-like protein
MPAEGRKRARDSGIPFDGVPGPLNAITDVPGVQVGYIPWGEINPLYAATVQAAEEAVINALAAGRAMTGQDGHWVPGLPSAQVGALVSQHREEASG